MGREIERKFLVCGTPWAAGSTRQRLVQGYLSLDPARTVRVRISDDSAWLTVKGITRGCSRTEHECEIPVTTAEGMMTLCLPGVIEKTRHRIHVGRHLWEVDEFHGTNAGLVIAEVELASETEEFEKPPWLGEEVTQDPRYYNASLSSHPFTTWRNPR
jgi:adenylate cyclase